MVVVVLTWWTKNTHSYNVCATGEGQLSPVRLPFEGEPGIVRECVGSAVVTDAAGERDASFVVLEISQPMEFLCTSTSRLVKCRGEEFSWLTARLSLRVLLGFYTSNTFQECKLNVQS